MKENEWFNKTLAELKDKLVELGIDENRIVAEYRIGERFFADCVVLSSDGKNPALCFEVKKTAKYFTDEYHQLAEIYDKYVGVGVCFLLYCENDEVVICDISGRKIRLKSDSSTLSRFLGWQVNDMAIVEVNQAADDSFEKLKNRVLYVSVFSFLIFVPLDILGLFPLTYERMIFIVVMVALVVVPYFLKVIVTHPELAKLIKRFFETPNK